MTTASAVWARDLSRRFLSASGEAVTALDGVDLDLPAGAMIVLCGPSGCGKSTLLNLLGLLDRPSGGTLSVSGVDLGALDDRGAARFRRERLGFLFQDAGLIEPMTAAGNVAVPLVYRGVARPAREEQVRQALARVELEGRSKAQVGELSGGERQRVALARALVSDPAVLICDEPTASLDEAAGRTIARLLLERAEAGAAVICSSHDPVLISQAHQVLSMSRGRVTVSGG